MSFRNHGAMLASPLLAITLVAIAAGAEPDANILKASGTAERLAKRAGVYNASSSGKTPGFVPDPSWPQHLPNNWIIGQVGGDRKSTRLNSSH